jgi:hypothetical protein
MNRKLTVALILDLAVIGLLAQTKPSKSPKEAVEGYWRLGEEGALLTRDGWAKANAVFAQPSPIYDEETIVVVSKRYSVEQLWMKEGRAEVDVVYKDLGMLDPKLVYKPPRKTHFFETAVRYQLSLTEQGVEPKWKIDGNKPVRWAGVDAVLTYLTAVQKNSTDPTVKKNATQSIAALTRYR